MPAAACALLLLASLACPDDAALAPFTATYELRYGSKRVGEQTLTLRETGARFWNLESKTEPKGLAKMLTGGITERSVFTLDGTELKPLVFNASESRGKSSQSVSYDWAQGVAHSERDGERVDLELKPRVVDHALLQIALMRDLASGRPLAPYLLVEKNELRSYDYERSGEEKLETPAGTYDTVRVRQSREGSTRELWFWCAPALQYLPVQVEQRKEGKVLFRMSLTSVRAGAAEAPDGAATPE
jgi:hypothetical protein